MLALPLCVLLKTWGSSDWTVSPGTARWWVWTWPLWSQQESDLSPGLCALIVAMCKLEWLPIPGGWYGLVVTQRLMQRPVQQWSAMHTTVTTCSLELYQRYQGPHLSIIFKHRYCMCAKGAYNHSGAKCAINLYFSNFNPVVELQTEYLSHFISLKLQITNQ